MGEARELFGVMMGSFCGPASLAERRRINLFACTNYGDDPLELSPAQAIEVGEALIALAREQGAPRGDRPPVP